MKPLSKFEGINAMFGHRPVPGRVYPPRPTGYQLQTTAGTILATCDTAEPLLRNLDDKRGCCVVRVKDGRVVAESPKAVADEAGLESA
jgi:hypothetical protein